MKTDRELAALLKLAMARYPEAPEDLALMYFRSDRRAAGDGALSGGSKFERKSRYAGIRNTKQRGLFDDQRIYYTSFIYKDYIERDKAAQRWVGPGAAMATFTQRRINIELANTIAFDPWDFDDQAGHVAGMLRAMRHQLRRAVDSELKKQRGQHD